jgi:iron complex outermembrane receptor protein
MYRHQFSPRPVALAASLLAASAFAQTPPPKEEKAQLDAVVITGIRASLESALNAKRQDKGIVDVIKAEDIAKFPDTNLAESLQRVPGVVIDRDAGEGRNITVRGLGADFTRCASTASRPWPPLAAPTAVAAPTAAVASTSTSSPPSSSTA